MSNDEEIIYYCRKLIAVYDTFDGLHSMRIHNEENSKAFIDEIIFNMKQLKKLLNEKEL